MSEEAVRKMLRGLLVEHMEALIEAIATPKRVAVLQALVDDYGCNPVRHKFLAEKFLGIISSSEISRILFKLTKAGLAVKMADGSFKATKLGKAVSIWLKLWTLYRLKDDPTARPYLRENLALALDILRIPSDEKEEELKQYLGEPGFRFLEEMKRELEREREKREERERSAFYAVLR